MKATLLLLILSLAVPSFAAETDSAAAIQKGAAWLLKQQQADGSFANPANAAPSQEHPALTALPLMALQRSGKAPADALKKAYAFIRSKAQPDGGIYTKGLSNYNTSVALMALLGSNDPQDEPILTKARAFIAGEQARDMAKPETNGGFGYGPVGTSPKRQHPDLDNTLAALEALAAYRHARPATELAKDQDLDFKAAIDFISRCQNLPETNSQPWASGDPANRGGAIYYPGASNAGEQTFPDGRKALRSYGTMTYAALLSFIYAELPKDDIRVKAAVDWLTKNYTLDENPGLGKAGLYYYYHLAVKGLAAADLKELTLTDGKKVEWRQQLRSKILSLQQPDGSWVNDTARWMETDPVLVTSYCLLALESLQGE
jgi:squalene-hopene/tetraprenyl-beta-curcumene cyclase